MGRERKESHEGKEEERKKGVIMSYGVREVEVSVVWVSPVSAALLGVSGDVQPKTELERGKRKTTKDLGDNFWTA